MQERFAIIKTPDGEMESFTTCPENGGPFPPVVLYMDIWGVREELYDIARRIAGVGYYCIVPDLYYRQGRIRYEFRNERGQTISGFRLPDPVRRMVSDTMLRLTNSMVMADTRHVLAFLRAERYVRSGGVGVVGYCMGGRHVLCAAALYSEQVVASACIHGTSLMEDHPVLGESPLRLAHQFRGELYCGFAEHDQHMSLQQVEEMTEILKGCSVRYEYAVHPGAVHGYALPERDIHDKQATARDWEHIFPMFHRRIPPYCG